MSAWRSFLWTLRSVFFDKGPVLPVIGGILLYYVFYPLPYKPETVRDVPVVVADYDSSPTSTRRWRFASKALLKASRKLRRAWSAARSVASS